MEIKPWSVYDSENFAEHCKTLHNQNSKLRILVMFLNSHDRSGHSCGCPICSEVSKLVVQLSFRINN